MDSKSHALSHLLYKCLVLRQLLTKEGELLFQGLDVPSSGNRLGPRNVVPQDDVARDVFLRAGGVAGAGVGGKERRAGRVTW